MIFEIILIVLLLWVLLVIRSVEKDWLRVIEFLEREECICGAIKKRQ